MRCVTIVSTKQPLTLRSCSTQLVCISHIYFQRQQTNTKDIAISHIALLNTARCDDVDDHNNDDDDEDGDYVDEHDEI